MKKFILFFCLICFSSLTGKSQSPKATLNNYLQLMLGKKHDVKFKFHTKSKNQFKNEKTWKEDGFGIQVKSNKINIYGHSERAHQNAVYYILEKLFACQYLTADQVLISSLNPEDSKDNTINKIKAQQTAILLNIQQNGLKDMLIEQIPAFEYREVFYGECRRVDYAKWHQLTHADSGNFENHKGWGLWVHTLHRLVPPEKYFQSHPEYFAERNGIRLKDQICMSSHEALKIAVKSLRAEMSFKPFAKYWSVSQMDNYNYCECTSCSKIDKEEISHAGSILRFVNQIADSFPDKIISTLAYQYSRNAPVITKPRSNVNIMLCTIESDRSKPIAGTDFETDLSNWSKVSQNILVWDYVINFSHLVMPFPNWQVLGPNLQLFKKYGVNMMFEQGYNSPSGDMEPLRAFLISKLLWNPDYSVDSLTKLFCEAYYGDASSNVISYINQQTNALNESKRSLSLYEPPISFANGYLSYEMLNRYEKNIYEAFKKTQNNKEIQQRLLMINQGIYYATLEVMKFSQSGDNWIFTLKNKRNRENPESHSPFYFADDFKPTYSEILNEFTKNANLYGPKILHEMRLSPDEFYKRTTQYWKQAITKHFAVSAPVLYLTKPDANYRDGSVILDSLDWQQNQSINNGIRGVNDYQYSWMGWWGRDAHIILDLGEATIVREVKTHFLENNEAWILGPASIEVMPYEFDNKLSRTYPYAVSENLQKGLKLPVGIHELKAEFQVPIQTRYLKIKINKLGKMPAWRGVNGDAWMFIDEIEVY